MILTRRFSFGYLILGTFLLVVSLIVVQIKNTEKAEAAYQPCYSNSGWIPFSASEIRQCITSDVEAGIQAADDSTQRALGYSNTTDRDGNLRPGFTRDCEGSRGDAFNYARCRVNYSAPYSIFNWSSVRGYPDRTNISVAGSGPVSVSMQTNNLKFLSGSLLNPITSSRSGDSRFGSDQDEDIQWMTSSNFPNDRVPIDPGANPAVNSAAHGNSKTHYDSSETRVTFGSGTVTFDTTDPTSYSYRRDSRYWFGQSVNFTYNGPAFGPSETSRTITFSVEYQRTAQSYSSWYCDLEASNGTIRDADDHSGCRVRTQSFTFTITRAPQPPVLTISGGNPSCTNDFGVSATDPEGGNISLQLQYQTAASWNNSGSAVSIASGRTHYFSISSYNDFGNRNFRVVGTDQSGQTATTSSYAVNRCAGVSCGGSTLDPAKPERGESFSMSNTFNISPVVGTSGRFEDYTVTLSTSNMTSTGAIDRGAPGRINRGNTSKTVEKDSSSSNNSTFTATWRMYDSAGNLLATCARTGVTVTKPYFRVYNGDIMAGTKNGCPGWSGYSSSSRIISFNKGDGSGAGSQLAAFALGELSGFTSASGRALPNAFRPPKALSFANTTPPTNTYGGRFGNGICPEDYGSNMPPDSSLTNTSNNITSRGTGNYTISGASNLFGTVQDGEEIYIYVRDRDVRIGGNITFENNSWGSVNNIPKFYLIVHGGNIYIDDDVTQLDGIYVSQPRGAAGGQIITCARNGSLPSESQIVNNCNSPLTVYGSFIAKQIRLLRSNGSLRNGLNAERWTSPSTRAAERFIFGPEFWLKPNTNAGIDNGTRYDSVRSLPPVL